MKRPLYNPYNRLNSNRGHRRLNSSYVNLDNGFDEFFIDAAEFPQIDFLADNIAIVKYLNSLPGSYRTSAQSGKWDDGSFEILDINLIDDNTVSVEYKIEFDIHGQNPWSKRQLKAYIEDALDDFR